MSTRTLLSWNILQGGGSRTGGIIEYLLEQQADVVLLQEYRSNTQGDQIAAALEKSGLRYQYRPEGESASRNTLFVASRLPFDAGEFMPADQAAGADTGEAQGSDSRVPVIEISIDGLLAMPVVILNAHFPHKQGQLPVFAQLHEDTESLLGLASLLIGDLNCGIPLQDSDSRTFDNTREFQRLLNAGWVDCWRSRNADRREFSWFSPRSGNGFRYDHALASPALDRCIISVSYDQRPREASLSDHASLKLLLSCPAD